MRKFMIEVLEDYGNGELAVDIEIALDGVIGEPSIDYIIKEITDDKTMDVDALVETICQIFGVHPVTMSVRVEKVKKLLREVL